MKSVEFGFEKNKAVYLKNESTPDCYKFGGDFKSLIEIAKNVFEAMEPMSKSDDIKERLLEYGGDVRAFGGGVFAIVLTGSKGSEKLFIQNRNARGDKQYQEKLREFLVNYI